MCAFRMGPREVRAEQAPPRRVLRGSERAFHHGCTRFGSVRRQPQRDRGSVQIHRTDKARVGIGCLDRARGRPRTDHQRLVGHQIRREIVRRVRGESTMNDREELTREELSRALTRAQRRRIIAGNLEPGDVAALRRFICLTQEQFAEALGISVHTLRNWEQDRVKPDGPGLALLRIAARHPRIVRENIDSAA